MRTRFVILTLLLVMVVGQVALAAQTELSANPVQASPSVHFSTGIRQQIVSLLDEAKRSVDVAMYVFTDSNLAWAVMRAYQRGLEVRVVLDEAQASGKYSKAVFLARRGLLVKLGKGQGNQGAMHHKFAVIDGATVVTGSYNWTASAEERNDENALILSDATVAKVYEDEFQRLWDGGTEVTPGQPGQPSPEKPAPCPHGTAPFVGNSDSKKLHRAGCPSVELMDPAHKVLFQTGKDALGAGYVACARCMPCP